MKGNQNSYTGYSNSVVNGLFVQWAQNELLVCESLTALCSLQDLTDSKRINTSIQVVLDQSGRDTKTVDEISATLVSELFWPQDALKKGDAVSSRGWADLKFPADVRC